MDSCSRLPWAGGMADFDLIVCDEAHRTTGVTIAGEDDSAFVRVHDQSFIRGATLRISRVSPTVASRLYAIEKNPRSITSPIYRHSFERTSVDARPLA